VLAASCSHNISAGRRREVDVDLLGVVSLSFKE
jgi:hypothetical protein